MNKYIRTTLIALVTIFISGCDDWLDISPKTQIKSDDNYASEQGYKDALTGVYLLMANESLRKGTDFRYDRCHGTVLHRYAKQ